jgi:hypothetical protein
MTRVMRKRSWKIVEIDLILRYSGSQHGGTSRFASRLIGEREVVRAQHPRGSSHGGGFFSQHSHDSVSHSVTYQHVTESAVLASKIEQLPDLQRFHKTASNPAWTRLALRPAL